MSRRHVAYDARAVRSPAPLAPRVLGRYDGEGDALVVAIGGLHGNEPGGLAAITRVLEALERDRIPLRGSLVGLSGNRKGLASGVRYHVRDLNRHWSVESCVETRDPAADRNPEDAEQRELWATIESLTDRHRKKAIFLDLHTTSGRAAPFLVMPDVERNLKMALQLPVPLVLGLEEILEGSLLGLLCEHGHAGMAAEGGQHTAPGTALQLEAVMWSALVAAGLLDEAHVPKAHVHEGRLRAASLGLPLVVEIKHRHAVTPDDAFEMQPGWANFTPVARGTVIAHDRTGPIAAPRDGRLMLPNYQSLDPAGGDDGFFVAIAVPRPWIRASLALRRLPLQRALGLWRGLEVRDACRIGVRGRPSAPLLAALHTLGFRGMRPEPGGFELFRRRPG